MTDGEAHHERISRNRFQCSDSRGDPYSDSDENGLLAACDGQERTGDRYENHLFGRSHATLFRRHLGAETAVSE